MKRVLVTGGSGFLGRHLQRSLRDLGMTVFTAGHDEIDDAADTRCWSALFKTAPPQIIFHLLGRTSAPNEDAFDGAHLLPTKALLSAAESSGLTSVPIHILGSAAEYGDVPENRQPIVEDETARPSSAYGRSKLRATETALQFSARGMHVVIVRPFNVFGSEMSSQMMPRALLAQLREKPLVIQTGPLDRVRDFLHAPVAMDALARLVVAEIPGGTILNLCSGRGFKLRDIVKAMTRAAGFTGELREGEEDSALSSGVRSCIGNPARWEKALGFRPLAPSLDDFARLVR